MFSVLLLFSVAGWVAWTYYADRRETRGDDHRREEIVETRRRVAERLPDSPAAQEALGDALRAAGRPAEAVVCYEQALAREAEIDENGPQRADTSVGIENKLRLTRTEVELAGRPAYGETMATRQQVCRTCGALNGPQTPNCAACGAPLPVDSFFDTLRNHQARRDIGGQTAEFVAMMAVVLLALTIASWLPLEVKGVLLMSTTIVLAWRFLKRIGGD